MCLATLALAAAWSSPALADDGVPDISIPAVPDLTAATTAVLEEAGLEELDLPAAVDPSIALPAVPAQTTAAEPVTAGAVAAPPPEPAAETPVEAASAVNPEPDAPPTPDVVQTAPTNVNISVRIDSPGDNGAVEQVNVATSTDEAAAAAAPAETAPQYQPDPPQYQQPIPASATPSADSAPQPPAAEPAQPVEGWTWNWTWNCGDALPDIPLPPEVGPQNWTWNWDWNCGESDPIPTNTTGQNPAQYQPGVTQYRPININISIRINSPGNDGPVSQTNVAVLVTAPTLPTLRIEVPVSPVGQAQSPSGGSETFAPLATLAAIVDGIGADPAEAPAAADDDCCLQHEPRGVAGAAEEPQSLLLPQAPPANRRDITPRERFRASVAVTVRLAKASEAAARKARPVPEPAQLRPVPHNPAGPKREQAAVLSAAGFAPVSASDGRLGQLLLVVAAFAFAIALADASRSVAAEVRAAGEDPDPPPDSPG